MKTLPSSLAVRLIVTAGLLALLVLVVADPREVVRVIASARPVPMIAAIVLSAADRCLMAYKWWLLLRVQGLAVNLGAAARTYFASSLIGLVLPVTVGADAVRVVAFRHLGVMEVMASIVIERALGVIAMASVVLFSCLLMATVITAFPVQSLTVWALAGAVLSAVMFIVSLALATRWAGRATGPSLLRKAAEAYGAYRRHPGVLAVFYGLSVVESLLCAVIAYVVAIGLGLTIPLYVFVATVPLALAVARLPVSLGGFGVQEASFVLLARLLGVSSTHALSIMLVSDIAMLLALLPSAFDSSVSLSRRAASQRLP